MKSDFAKLLEKSVISQALLSTIVFGGALAVQLNQGSLPDWLQIAVGACLGFFFGAKTMQSNNRIENTISDALEIQSPDTLKKIRDAHNKPARGE